MDANDTKITDISFLGRSLSKSSSLPVIIILVSSLLFSLLVWKQYDNILKARSEVLFANKTDEITNRITERLRDNEQLLLGAGGLFTTNKEVSRADWRNYISAMRLDENQPGILGVGFSKWLSPAEKLAHINKIRSEGFPEYIIRPGGERSAYTSIIYLEPFNWRNQRAFGYDMYSEPLRKAAMDKARDENRTTIAAKILLVQETDKDKQSGMLMYVPVYRQGMQLDSVEQRRKAFIGFVYSPIRMNDFVSDTVEKLTENIAFEINVAGPATDTLLFSSVQDAKLIVHKQYKAALNKTISVQWYGCPLKFTFTTLPTFGKESGSSESYPVLIAGILFSILLSGLVFLMIRNKSQAVDIAKEKLRQSDCYLDNLFSYANAPIVVWDTNFRITRINKVFEGLIGRTADTVIGSDITLYFPQDQIDHSIALIKNAVAGEHWDSSEIQILHCSGTVSYILWNSATVFAADGTTPVAVIAQGYDITKRTAIEKALHAKETYISSLVQAIPSMIFVLDSAGVYIDCSGGNGKDLVMQKEIFLGKSIFEILPGDVAVQLKTGITAVLQQQKEYVIEYELLLLNGTTFFECTIVALDETKVLAISNNITLRKKLEAKTQDALEYAENIIETLREPMLVLDTDLRIISANHSFYETFAVNPVDTIGYFIYDLGNRQWDIPRLRELLEEILPLNSVINGYEVKHDFPDIGKKTILLNARQIFRESVSSHIILLAMEDITERRNAGDKLRRLSRAVEQSPASIVITDVHGIIEFVNPAFTRITGYSAEMAIGLNPRVLKSGQTSPETYKELWSSLTSGGTWEGELLNRFKDGRLFWEHCNISALHGENMEITHYVASKVDITERKLAEVALRRSEGFLRVLIDVIPGLVAYWSSDLHCTFANTAYLEWFGKTPEQMQGIHLRDFLGDQLFSSNEPFIDAVLQGKPQLFERTITTADASIRQTLVHYIPDVEDDNVLGFIALVTDVTGLKRSQYELERLNVELFQQTIDATSATKAKSQFLANMSHEIRTPMNGLIGMIQLLQHTELTTEQHEYAESAKCAGLELVDLLNDILDISKIEAEMIIIEVSDFDLKSVISDTSKLLLLQASEKGLELTARIDTEVPTLLKGDIGRLRQIIRNLMGNAIKFTPKGAITLQIRKESEDEQTATLCFLVSDSGIGIEADKLEHIFKPFTQADNSTTRLYGGTGLGLTICKRLAELMGGSVGVESVVGEGATFWFTAVLEKQANKMLEINPESTPTLDGGITVNINDDVRPFALASRDPGVESSIPIRILLAEDDPRARKIVPKLLKSYGYLVDVVVDGEEALRALEADDYALVLMDCMMPGMDGYGATAVIRDLSSNVRRHDIPIIALTGNAGKEDIERCIAAGMDDHLPKPLKLEDLLERLGNWSQVQGM